jgi:hypothetical protein
MTSVTYLMVSLPTLTVTISAVDSSDINSSLYPTTDRWTETSGTLSIIVNAQLCEKKW